MRIPRLTRVLVLPAPALPVAAAAQSALPQADPSAPPNWLLYGIVIVSGAVALFGALATISLLRRSTWSIRDAMSESGEVTLEDANGMPVLDAQGRPVKVARMIASSSRLIAFLGLIGILTLFMAQGLLLVWRTAHGDPIAQVATDFSNYLIYGSVMFAPYVVNKFSSVFSGFGPGK